MPNLPVRQWFTILSEKVSISGHDYALISWLFIRGLALIYLAAFVSMSVQIEGLIGNNGILPLNEKLDSLSVLIPEQKYWLFPTLFWLDASDLTLKLVCYTGVVAALLLFFNFFTRYLLIACFILYLSIATAAQAFTAFQWDSFLLESGFLAIFLSWGSGFIIFLFRWLIARFMFMGGIVKLASGDPSWSSLTALRYHYQTQPLPSPLAYYAYYLPDWFNRMCVAGVFFIELIVPFFVFLPRRYRIFAAWSFIALQISIILTGNYGFFNLLTILLCLFLFTDTDVEKILPQRLELRIRNKTPEPGKATTFIAALWTDTVLLICFTNLWMYHARTFPVTPLKYLTQTATLFSLVNNYGPFAIMTRERPEIIIEGSYDGNQWQAYEFNNKPGKLATKLRWNIPHQPRLDWQMWFAALKAPQIPLWLNNFLQKLHEDSPEVLALLTDNPFANKPPDYIRLHLFRYSYTSRETRAATGHIWQRQELGVYWVSKEAKK